jgi:hypothetical protein
MNDSPEYPALRPNCSSLWRPESAINEATSIPPFLPLDQVDHGFPSPPAQTRFVLYPTHSIIDGFRIAVELAEGNCIR